ncbi:maleylpyruvate isomerase family mycothiol-dependent enzyme [Streptomyces sp. Tue6028]|uniref:maleylpyruvate isomerase family mycothiol-dependent enzyme n=1 Tax=Streptomyces sp. Tue6028 TaxID=2036037 RepID=UPI003D757073
MSGEHEAVRDLLAAWAVGALTPADERTVPRHLAACESCAAEAERLRETVRLLDGPRATPPGPATGPVNGAGTGRAARGTRDTAPAGRGRPTGGDGPGGRPAGPDGAAGLPPALLAAARRARPAAPRVAAHAAPYAAAVAGLGALLSELDAPGSWSTPVVHDWDVQATVAHLIAADEPLARRLGLAPRVPWSAGAEKAGWEAAWAARTAEVIAHERARTPAETVAVWSAQAAALLAVPEAADAGRAAHATTLMGVRLPVADHFVVRAFEAWIHTDDIGRALGLTVPPPPEPHLWQLVRLAVRILGRALGPTAAPVLFAPAGGGRDAQWVLGSEDEPVAAELVLDPVDFCLLIGGRYAPGEVPRGAVGDTAAVTAVLERAASLAWL